MEVGFAGLGVVAALIFANAVFVATEFAYVTARRSRLAERAAEGSRGASVVLRALGNLDRYVAGSQLGITMASLALGFVGEPLFAALIEPALIGLVGAFAPGAAHAVAIGVAFLLITALHIVFGELAPKTVALQRPEATAIWVAHPMRLFMVAFGPMVSLLNGAGNAILRLIGVATTPIGETRPLSSQDLAYAFESSASIGIISRRELELAQRVLRLEGTDVRDVMRPRSEIVSVDVADERAVVLRTAATHGRSRFPVVRGSLDDLVGVVDVSEVVPAGDGRDWRELVRPMTLIPDRAPLTTAVASLLDAPGQVALVVDEYGTIEGLVSRADVFEFLTGPLPDELAGREPQPRRLPGGEFEVPGLYRLTAAAQAPLRLEAGESETDTLGGLVMERLGRVPRAGDEVRIDGRRVRVLAMDARRVASVAVEPPPDAETDDAAG